MEDNKYYRPDPLDKTKYFNEDLDFTTNSPSYYETLARFTTTLRLLTERLDDVEGRVIDLFLDWLRDGVIEEIINVNIFTDLNNRLKKIREDFDSHIEEEFNPLKTDFNTHLEEYTLFSEKVNSELDKIDKEIDRINKEVTSVKNDLTSFKVSTNNNLKKLNDSVPLHHHVSESFSNLQQAIYGAEGGVLYIKPSTYTITNPIKIRSNTKIIAYGSTFIRGANIDNMFINDSNGSKGGYNANKNIEIYGATFNGSGGTYQDKCTILAFGHSQNIKIIDCAFKNLIDWHMVELNSVRNVLVKNCTFENYGNNFTGSEMLQIDLARGSAQFPWFGPYDDTTCESVTITQCKFRNGVRGVGTHSSSTGAEHHRIYILKNEFYDMRSEAVYGLDWAFTKIHSNHFYNVQKGVHLRVKGLSVHNHSIVDNYMSGLNNEDSRGIQISGIIDGNYLRGGTIKDNKIKRFGGHGIGVDNSDTWVIDNNDITSNGKSGIIVFNSIHCTVSNNISRTNNTREGSDYDITSSRNSKKVIYSGNIADVIMCSSSVEDLMAIGNIAHRSLTINGAKNHAVNNVVGGVLE